jgi:hypothetical protein
MPVTIEMPTDEPIVVAVYTEPFDATREFPVLFGRIAALRQEKGPAKVLINDISALKTSFSEMVLALAEVRSTVQRLRKMGEEPLEHYILVGSSDMVKMGADALGQQQYAGNAATVVASIDEALAHARSLLAKESEESSEESGDETP